MEEFTPTLMIRRLPRQFTAKDKDEFLKYFGATDVKCFPCNIKMKNSALATFRNVEAAKVVMSRLHQVKILDTVLSVEFAHKKSMNEKVEADNNDSNNMAISTQKVGEIAEHVAPQFGLKYPPNLGLKYKYPSPNANVIINMCAAILATPALYNQVLHLMNKMNMPSPFHPALVIPTMLKNHLFEKFSFDNEARSPSVASDESEIETEINEKVLKRRNKKLGVLTHKKLSRQLKRKYDLSHEKVVATKSRKVSMKKMFNVKEISNKNIKINAPKLKEAQEVSTYQLPNEEGFGKIEKTIDIKVTEKLESNEPNYGNMDFITEKQLSSNRLTYKDMKEISLFEKYKPGEPTSRLYIKNLAKQVKEKDLAFIFGRYVDFSNTEESNMFDIRVMTQGRMKGQAFVGLPSVEIAKKAILECNGYKLLNKPIIIQFARSAKAKT